MRLILIIVLSFLIISCNQNQEKQTKDFNLGLRNSSISKDTLITYNINKISTEGAEAKVNYKNGRIIKSVTNIYAGTWQASIYYKFLKDKIEVIESKYLYNTEIENVKSLDDMRLDYKITYFIDFNGNLLEKKNINRLDIFNEFKEVVPFKLNY